MSVAKPIKADNCVDVGNMISVLRAVETDADSWDEFWVG